MRVTRIVLGSDRQRWSVGDQRSDSAPRLVSITFSLVTVTTRTCFAFFKTDSASATALAAGRLKSHAMTTVTNERRVLIYLNLDLAWQPSHEIRTATKRRNALPLAWAVSGEVAQALPTATRMTTRGASLWTSSARQRSVPGRSRCCSSCSNTEPQ
jgi:hypothetical protein